MKHRESTNASGRPAYEGQYKLFRSPHAHDTLLLDVAVRDSRSQLAWAAVDDDLKRNAAVCAFHAIKGGVADPCIRTSVLRQYAVNLMVRIVDKEEVSPDRFDNIALGISVVLQNTQSGRKAIPYAISQGLESERPYLAEIEEMLARGSRLTIGRGGVETTAAPRHALGILEDLRAGRDPSGGMFPVVDQLKALQLQYPALNRVDLMPAEPDHTPFSDVGMP